MRRQTDGTTCIVDLQDTCVASITELPADFDVDDLPADVPTLPTSREPEPEPPTTGAPTPGSPGAVGDPEPTPPKERGTPPTKERGSYDYEWTVDVVVSDDRPDPPVLTADQLAADRAKWAAEAECVRTHKMEKLFDTQARGIEEVNGTGTPPTSIHRGSRLPFQSIGGFIGCWVKPACRMAWITATRK